MLKKTANKIEKKRGGILHVFNKTISELDKLNGQTEAQIKVQDEKIQKEQAEKDALLKESKQISKITSKMKSLFDLDDEETAPESAIEIKS